MNDKDTVKPFVRKGESSAKPSGKGDKNGSRRKGFVVQLAWFTTDRLKWLLLALLSVLFAVCLFPNILSHAPSYQVGDVAGTGIKASHDFLIENTEQTEKNRVLAAKQALAVYDFDRSASDLVQRLQDAFSFGRERYSQLFPAQPPDAVEGAGSVPGPTADEKAAFRDEFFAILEIPQDQALFDLLLNTGFSERVEQAAVPLLKDALSAGIVANMDRLLAQSEKGGIILHNIYSQQETTVTSVDRFSDLDRAANSIADQADALERKLGSRADSRAAVDLALFLLQPNVTFNQRESELRKEKARSEVKPTYFQIKKGEMLVREGERIGPEHIERLAGEFRSRDRLDMLARIPAMAVFIGLFFATLYIVGYRGIHVIGDNRRDLLFSAVAIIGFFLSAWAYRFVADEVARGFPLLSPRTLLYAMPVACAGMLISIFQGMAAATVFSLAASLLASLICGGQAAFFVYFFLGSLVAAYGVRRCTERGTLIKAGLKVGLINTALALSMEMIYGSIYSTDTLLAVCFGFAGGILTAIISTGLLPLLEMSFGYTTDIKLLELANLDQPLLRQLLVQAPGTYHHSVIISNLVEATAQAINANPLLAKVCAYYHDIGKMKKPQYFIENQQGGENKHEKLAPSMSSLILTTHVKDGVELAKAHGLGKEIIDTIQQHHGTSLITYFYEKARERAEANTEKYANVKQEDFRYPGPKPQTKEAGLVMLADMVEAASRSLSDPTPSRIQGVVQKMINKAFSDGQLDECEITLKDLHEIAKSFNKTLGGIFHQRIKYPEPGEIRTEKKNRNGHSDQRPEDDTGARKPEDPRRAEEGLKRLGLS